MSYIRVVRNKRLGKKSAPYISSSFWSVLLLWQHNKQFCFQINKRQVAYFIHSFRNGVKMRYVHKHKESILCSTPTRSGISSWFLKPIASCKTLDLNQTAGP